MMDLKTRAELVAAELKAFRARRLPSMPTVDSAGISTRPWGSRRISGIGLGRYSGPSQTALDAWTRATRAPRRRNRLIGAPRL